jgi:hypothetical protein
VQATGTGTIQLIGTGGTANASNIGVELYNNAQVIVDQGSLTMTGQGGTGTGGASGVNIGLNCTVSSTGGGSITLKGTGGTGGNSCSGVRFSQCNIITTTGNILIDGMGGTGAGSLVGIQTQGSTVFTSTGTGMITMKGTGGIGTSTNQSGIAIAATAVSITDGDLNMTGITGTGTSSNHGIGISSGICSFVSTGAGAMNLNGTSNVGTTNDKGIHLIGATTTFLSSGSGPINFIGVGGPGGATSSGISVSDSSVITTGTGPITFDGIGGNSNGTLQHGIIITGTTGLVETQSGAPITFRGTANGSAGTSSDGIIISAGGGVNSTANGTITLIGQSSGTGTNCDGVSVTGAGSRVSTANGNISISATYNGASGTTRGMMIESSGVVSSSGAGSISINSTNNSTGSTAPGTLIRTAGAINSTGTGPISINSTAHGVSDSSGVFMDGTTGNATILSASGNISIVGNALGTGTRNRGIYLQSSPGTALINALSTSAITMTGSGGNGTSDNQGIMVDGPTSFINSVNGNIRLLGSGNGGAPNQGILLTNNGTATPSVFSSGSGNIHLEAVLNDLQIESRVTSTSGTMTLLAVNTLANVIFDINGLINCGNALFCAANLDIDIRSPVTIQSALNGTFVVDEAAGCAGGAGWFYLRSGTSITALNNNVAIYAVNGFLSCPDITPSLQVDLSGIVNGAPATNLETWDMNISPYFLCSKYATSFQCGGPYHGPGFGTAYIPGNGVFSSPVIWYKFPFEPPLPPPLSPEDQVAIQNTTGPLQVLPLYYLYQPFLKRFEYCSGLPCIVSSSCIQDDWDHFKKSCECEQCEGF